MGSYNSPDEQVEFDCERQKIPSRERFLHTFSRRFRNIAHLATTPVHGLTGCIIDDAVYKNQSEIKMADYIPGWSKWRRHQELETPI
jgi:hypothetical protein